jgi:hypothetical protein
VVITPIVETRLAIKPEPHRAAHDPHHPDQAVSVSGRGTGDRHEVDDLAHTVGTQEAGEQDRCSGKVQLLRHIAGALRDDLKVTALLPVEQGGEDAGRVETRSAEPVDRAVRRDQRRGLQIAN